ncbi:hypothetical protein PM082_016652 [Marasmius tenuissimus]|nr:hypothetical protein PM082_016652 [Marasmius tenuissimus]
MNQCQCRVRVAESGAEGSSAGVLFIRPYVGPDRSHRNPRFQLMVRNVANALTSHDKFWVIIPTKPLPFKRCRSIDVTNRVDLLLIPPLERSGIHRTGERSANRRASECATRNVLPHRGESSGKWDSLGVVVR